MGLPDLEVLEVRRAARPAAWPYVPGCLSFREAPAVLEAFRQVRTEPDVVLVDGQGRAHPRRLGLASHVGLCLGVPTIGCAKSRLVGTAAGEPGLRRGGRVPLMDGGERIGTVLRTRSGVKPVFVSVGHRIDLVSAERWVLAAATRYRLPEPIRAAHRLTTEYKAALAAGGA
jgi:deoxyribonuclease V